MICENTYSLNNRYISLQMTMYYKATSESEWVQCDQQSFQSGSSQDQQAQILTMTGIPQGSYSAKISLACLTAGKQAKMKNAGSDWVTELTYGSGNDGWQEDYTTALTLQVY